MNAQQADSDTRMLLADLQALAEQAARPPDTPLSNDASHALGRVYGRFVRRVYAFCRKRIRFSLPPDRSLEEFVETLFFRFARSADKIKLRNTDSLAEVEAQLLKCFHGHAIWTLKDSLEEAAKLDQLAGAIMRDLGTPRPETELPSTSIVIANRSRLRDELDRMGDRARDVLLTSYQHLDLDSGQFRLPDEVRDDLCRRCNFNSPNALVQYRLRRIAELRSKLTSVA